MSVLIIPDDGTQTREFKIGYWLIHAFVVFQVCLIVLVLFVGFFYWRSLEWEGEALRLRHDNHRTRAELARVHDLATVVERMKRVDQQLRAILSHGMTLEPPLYTPHVESVPGSDLELEDRRVTVRRVAARSDGPTESRFVPSFWPVSRSVSWVTQRYHVAEGVMLDGHTGIDIAASEGTVVMAAADGEIVFAGEDPSLGLVVSIDHFGAYLTRYGHNAALIVTPGERVRKGQPIALVGNTGRSSAPHLHFEVWERGSARNPMDYLPD